MGRSKLLLLVAGGPAPYDVLEGSSVLMEEELTGFINARSASDVPVE